MPSTTAGCAAIRSATCGAALSVSLLMTGACGIGHVADHAGSGGGPSYAVDTAPTTAPTVVRVRVHGHMGRPGVDARAAALR
jgi:hypothetical protein